MSPQEVSGVMRYLAYLVSTAAPEVLAVPVCQAAAREALDTLRAGMAAADLTTSTRAEHR